MTRYDKAGVVFFHRGPLTQRAIDYIYRYISHETDAAGGNITSATRLNHPMHDLPSISTLFFSRFFFIAKTQKRKTPTILG